jgi:methyltransferase (TIGR00027 family)
MATEKTETPDNTAVRVALWRALHAEIDPAPHVIEDLLGVRLAAPEDAWRRRGDMHPERTKRNRASIVARARFIEDLVEAEAAKGVGQYVLLGAGLDTFAQRRPEIASTMRLFEIDQPVTQAWKRRRLLELGLGAPDWLKLVPVDFEAGGSWPDELAQAGFDAHQPAVVASTGVAIYLTKAANMATLRQIAGFAAGSTLALSFSPPLDLIEPEERPAIEGARRGAAANGTPFIGFYAPEEMLEMAREAGFKTVRHVSSADLAALYFSGRTDGLRPSSFEQILVATT